MERHINKKLQTQPYLHYQVNHIQNNKEVTELCVYDSIDTSINMKAYALGGLCKDPRCSFRVF